MENYILIGGNLPPEVSKELVEEIKLRISVISNRENSALLPDGCVVLPLVPFEVNKIVKAREQVADLNDIENFLSKKETAESYRNDAITFIKEAKQKTGSVIWYKNQTTMSWSKFKAVLKNWELFGIIKFLDENKSQIQFCLEEEDLKRNIISNIDEEIISLTRTLRAVASNFSPEERKKLTAFEKKLKNPLNDNR